MLHAILKYITKFSLCKRLIYICQHLPTGLPRYWEHVTRFVNLTSSEDGNNLTEEQCRLCFENITSLDADAVQSESTLFKELCAYSNKADFPLGYVLVSSNNTCRVCKSKLRVKSRGKEISKVVLYDDERGTFLASHLTKFCSNGKCFFRQYYGKHTLTGQELLYDPDWAENMYLLSTWETGFALSMLRRFDVEILIGQISYQQRARIYNSYHGYSVKELKTVQGKTLRSETSLQPQRKPYSSCETLLQERKSLDRRRLEDGHLQYAMLKVIEYYPNKLELEKISFKEIGKAIQIITPLFHESFTSYYSEHRCDVPGCRSCLVIDGNMKNSREVCKATDVGFLQYEGLPGAIPTGCINSPSFESRYCDEHKDYSCELRSGMNGATQEELFTGPITREMSKKHGDLVQDNGIVEAILDKKETRSNTYYKVKFLGRSESEISWEPEDELPRHLLELFNSKGRAVDSEVVVKQSNYNGQISQIYSLKMADREGGEPVSKKSRQSKELPQQGVFANEVFSLTCKTEKDKNIRKRKNERTAGNNFDMTLYILSLYKGILCGMWPCGIFNIFAELYKSESKAQVYAVLHEAMRINQEQFQNLEYVVYDDGCHLKKYAQNNNRCYLTEQTEKLSSTHIVVDKMHMKGHVDPWCKINCDSRNIKELEKVDTEVCEQAFSWLSSYKKITRRMNQENFIFFILYLLHLHNKREEDKLINSGLMSKH